MNPSELIERAAIAVARRKAESALRAVEAEVQALDPEPDPARPSFSQTRRAVLRSIAVIKAEIRDHGDAFTLRHWRSMRKAIGELSKACDVIRRAQRIAVRPPGRHH